MLLWPSRMVFPIMEGDFRDLEFLPTGVLTVTIIEATGLMKTDIIGNSDPFIFVYGKLCLQQPLRVFFCLVFCASPSCRSQRDGVKEDGHERQAGFLRLWV